MFARDENVAIAYGMGITAEKVAEEWKVSREDQDAFALASHRKALAARQPASSLRRSPRTRVVSRVPDLAGNAVRLKKLLVDRTRARAPTPRPRAGEAADRVPQRPVRRHGHRRQLLADERRRRRGLLASEQAIRTTA